MIIKENGINIAADNYLRVFNRYLGEFAELKAGLTKAKRSSCCPRLSPTFALRFRQARKEKLSNCTSSKLFKNRFNRTYISASLYIGPRY